MISTLGSNCTFWGGGGGGGGQAKVFVVYDFLYLDKFFTPFIHPAADGKTQTTLTLLLGWVLTEFDFYCKIMSQVLLFLMRNRSHRPLYSSATDALVTLKWLTLEQRRSYHRCIYVYKCINGLVDHSMKLLTNSDIHKYNTRNKDMLRLPYVTRNWGKQRVCHYSLKDWTELERDQKCTEYCYF